MTLQENQLICGDSIEGMRTFPENSLHLILSDIPYGIGVDTWDVLHENTNHAYLGSSPAQKKAGRIFQKRGKPLNGWSEADRAIPKQYYEWCMRWAGEWNRVLKPGASAIVFAGRRLAHRCICAMEDSGFILRDLLAWDKVRSPYRAQRVRIIFERRGDNTAAQMWDGWRVGNLRPRFEPILWFVKPYPIGGTIATNLLENGVGAYHEKAMLQWGCPQDNILAIPSLPTDGGLHPTQKPLKLMQILIDLTTKPGQWVCDPFCGSGTTLVAAQKMGRKFTGFEIDESFYLTAQKRLEKECEQMKLVCMD